MKINKDMSQEDLEYLVKQAIDRLTDQITKERDRLVAEIRAKVVVAHIVWGIFLILLAILDGTSSLLPTSFSWSRLATAIVIVVFGLIGSLGYGGLLLYQLYEMSKSLRPGSYVGKQAIFVGEISKIRRTVRDRKKQELKPFDTWEILKKNYPTVFDLELDFSFVAEEETLGS